MKIKKLDISFPFLRICIPLKRDANKVWQLNFVCPVFNYIYTNYKDSPTQKIEASTSHIIYWFWYIKIS